MDFPTSIDAASRFMFDGVPMRVIQHGGEPRFVAADVCAVLGLMNNRDALGKLDADEKGVALTDTLGGAQQVATITESGLYTLILRSRGATTPGTLPHRFRRWVTGEVLPAIRKSGGYMVATPDETPEALALRALTVLQATVERQKVQIAAIQPKADALDLIAGADGSLSITEAAKALQMQPKALFSYLQQNRWLYKREGSTNWLGYQARVQTGDLVHKVSTILHPDGNERIREQVRVTAKGVTKLAKLVGSACALLPLERAA